MIEFISDNEAWEYLKYRGYERHSELIYRFKLKGHVMTKKEKYAIEYLVNEWDWSYTN